MKQLNILVAMAAMACGSASAQQPDKVFFFAGADTAKLRVEADTIGFHTVRFGMMGPTVKGAPYSAEGVTEVTQTLGDGTHINRQETYTIYRDGEGRVRRETGNEIWISDPVAEASYVLNTKQQTARKLPLSRIVHDKMHLDKVKAETAALVGSGGVMVRKAEQPEKTESLGKQEMEGVEVEGTRGTTVIPEGQIGNDRPLQMVNERWESTELHVTILSRHMDPIMGDRTERLTNIRRGEPDPALFQVPASYQMDSEK